MKKIIIVFLLIMLTGEYVQAADKLFVTFDAIPIPDDGIGSPGAEKTPVVLDLDLATQLTDGQQFDVPLLDGQIVLGTVKNETENQEGETVEIVSFDNGKGGLELTMRGGSVSEMLLFDKDKTKFYRAKLNTSGVGAFIEEDPNNHICVEYPLPSAIALATEKIPAGIEELTPDTDTLKTLQSKPSAPNVIYIDYWGGTLSGTAWNDGYNSGEDIVYTPFDNDNNIDFFSNTERYLMWLGWREVVEDFAPFDVNVTTDPAVYNATPVTNRIRNISTNTNFFFPGYGGVAMFFAFGQNNEYTAVSWTWNDQAGTHGMTISHELGHQLNLNHDGTSEYTYYGGHNNWGSIMGAPFGKSYVQWNKGEYPDANNLENDLDIIKAQLGVVIDDIDDTIATATSINANQTDLVGLIVPLGISGEDVDYYKFTLPSSAPTRIDISSLIISENSGELFGTNLSLQVTLLNAQQVPIADTNQTFLPFTNRFIYDDALEAGTYYLKIEALSPDLSLNTGFGEYGNGGMYRVLINPIVDTFEDNYKLDSEFPFEWIDATSGNRLSISDTDDELDAITIGFDFEFYGTPYSDVSIDSNGTLTFGDIEFSVLTNEPIPSNIQPNGFIAPYWDDLYPGLFDTANIYTLLEGTAPNRRLTIAWVEIPLYNESTDSPVTFEVTLYEGSNDIVFQYGNAYLADSATIGIEHPSGDFGLQYLFNGQNNGEPVQIHQEQAIRFYFEEDTRPGTTLIPSDDANNRADLDGILAVSKWTHAFFRFDASTVQQEINKATLRIYYEARRAPLTLYVGAVEDDDWSEGNDTPAVTFIHDIPELQLDSVEATAPGYVEFDVTNFVAEQVSSDGIVTLEVSSNHDNWDILSSKEGAFPPELVIEIQDTVAPSVPTGLTLDSVTGNTVSFSWTPSTDDLGTVVLYHVMRDGIEIGTSSVASFTDNTVAENSSYVYNVTAEDDSGNESAISDDLIVNTPILLKTILIPSDDANNRADLDGVLAVSKWTHAFFRFDASTVQQEVNRATLRVYYEARRAPLTLFVGAVENDDWSDDSNTPAVTFIHDRPELQLDSVDATAPGYVEFDVTNFVAEQVSSDGIVTLEVSSSHDNWDILSSKEGTFPPELIIETALDIGSELTAAYPFEEGSGQAIVDITGNGNNGTLEDDAARNPSGKNGEAIEFNGENSYIDLGAMDIISPTMSIAMWFKADDFGIHDARLISKSTGTAESDHYWMVSTIRSGGQQKLRFRLKTANGGTATLIGSAVLTPGVWTHVTATYDGAEMKLFQDGVEVGSLTKSGTISTSASVETWIGANPGNTRYFDGLIDDVRIYGEAIGLTTIEDIMLGNLSLIP